MIRKPWLPEDDARLAELIRDGVKSAEIAARLRRPRGSVNCRVVKLGLSKKAQRGDQNPVWIAIKAICADGVGRTVHELAAATGEKHPNIERLFYVRRDQNQAHVVGYEPVPRGTSRPLWLPQPGEDVPRNGVTAEAQRQRALRIKRAEEEKLLAKEWKVNVKTGPAPRLIGAAQHELVRAFYGMGAAA